MLILFFGFFLEYGIPEVLSTYPAIDSEISPSTTIINITYKLDVAFSSQNISIYQNISGKSYLRQRIPANKGENVTFSANSISIEILSSTFNRANADYYVVIDDDAIKNKKNSQPLIGVEKGYWKFRTGM